MLPPFLKTPVARAIREMQFQNSGARRIFDGAWLAAALPENSAVGALILYRSRQPSTVAK